MYLVITKYDGKDDFYFLYADGEKLKAIREQIERTKNDFKSVIIQYYKCSSNRGFPLLEYRDKKWINLDEDLLERLS